MAKFKPGDSLRLPSGYGVFSRQVATVRKVHEETDTVYTEDIRVGEFLLEQPAFSLSLCELVQPAQPEPVADECAVCGCEAVDSIWTFYCHGKAWRACGACGKQVTPNHAEKRIYERHIKPKEQQSDDAYTIKVHPEWPIAEPLKPRICSCGQSSATIVWKGDRCADCMLKERPELTQNEGARQRNIAALAAELSRPVRPRFPSVGRDCRVYGRNRR